MRRAPHPLKLLLFLLFAIRWILLVFVLPTYAAPISQNTFVGNGGNAGDLELEITLKQISSTADSIDDKTKDLCICPEAYYERPIGRYLQDLTVQQKDYCEKKLKTHATDIK